MSSRDRHTGPVGRRTPARISAPEFAAADSDVRPLIPLFAVPWLVVTLDELQRLPLEPEAGFLVSLIDGRSTVEMLLDISGMHENRTLDILAQLLRLGAIELRDPR